MDVSLETPRPDNTRMFEDDDGNDPPPPQGVLAVAVPPMMARPPLLQAQEGPQMMPLAPVDMDRILEGEMESDE